MKRAINFLKKRAKPLLQLEEYHKSFVVKKRDNVNFCLCLRHDMDLMKKDLIKEFTNFEKELGIHSTCFFMVSQLSEAKKEIQFLKGEGWDVELHSQSRPFTFTPSPSKFEQHYRNKLRKELSRSFSLGFTFAGHAPHGIHCYAGYGPELDWDLFESATIDSGLRWICSYRLVIGTEHGQDFLSPLPSYTILGKFRNKAVNVYQTSWDDRFFLSTPFRKQLFGSKKRSLEEARKNIKQQLNFCQTSNIPFIISLHPFQFLKENATYSRELLYWLIAHCRQESISIKTLEQIDS